MGEGHCPLDDSCCVCLDHGCTSAIPRQGLLLGVQLNFARVSDLLYTILGQLND